jgi:peptidyl-prolyl cis-trans isomerase C
MRVSTKRFDKLTVPSRVEGLIVLVVCVMISTSFASSKPKKDAQMTAKPSVQADVNKPAEEAVKAPAPPPAPAAPSEAKKVEPSMKAKSPAVEPSAMKPEAGSTETAVTVNGINITEGEVDARLKPILERAARQMDPNSIEMYKKRLRPQAIEGMVMERLLDEQVTKAGITVNDEDVNKMINDMISQQGMTMDSFKAMLQMRGQSFEQFTQQIKPRLSYEKLMEHQLGKVDINDAEALAFYNENKADFNTSEEVQASHILIKISPTATAEEKAAARAKTEKLLKQVKEGGDFAALAMENSDDPGSKVKGGDLGFFAKGMMVKEFETVAFAMKPGQVSDIVETQFGYHIIKVTDHKDAGLTPFEKAKPEIIKELSNTKKNQLAGEYVNKLKAEAKIVYPAGKEPAPMPMMPPRPTMQPRPTAPPKGAMPK